MEYILLISHWMVFFYLVHRFVVDYSPQQRFQRQILIVLMLVSLHGIGCLGEGVLETLTIQVHYICHSNLPPLVG